MVLPSAAVTLCTLLAPMAVKSAQESQEQPLPSERAALSYAAKEYLLPN